MELDPHPFTRGGSFVIVLVSVLHILQAGLLAASPAAGNATCLTMLLKILDGIAGDLAPLILLSTAALALWGALMRLGHIRLVILLPQHFILGIMALGGLYAALNGAYLDGTVKPWEHISADQLPMMVLFIIHSVAVLRRARDPNG